MYYQNLKPEVKQTFSRLIKINKLKQKYCLLNIGFYPILLKYSLIKYFFRRQLINLNHKLMSKLIKEELGSLIILHKWIFKILTKNY